MAAIQLRRFLLPTAVLVAAIATAGAAQAFPSSRLIYARGKGTDQCPDEDVVRAEVAARLGYDPFFVWAERTIVAQISRAARGFQATVQLLDAKGVVRGSRALSSTSSDCNDLVKAVALAISIGIDPEAASGTPAPATSPREQSATPTEPPAPAEPAQPLVVPPTMLGEKQDAPRPASSSAPQMEPEVGVGAWSAVNLAPAISVGGTLFGGLSWGHAVAFLEVRQNLQSSGHGISAALLAGAFVPCARFDVFLACANVTLGELHFQGARSASVTYIALGARAGIDVPIFRQFRLRGHVDALRSLDQTIVIQSGIEAWQLPAVSGAVGLDVAMRF